MLGLTLFAILATSFAESIKLEYKTEIPITSGLKSDIVLAIYSSVCPFKYLLFLMGVTTITPFLMP